MSTMKDAASIVGIGHTEYSKNSGRSELQLAAEAARAAIRDAGIAASDIDGMVTFTQDENDELLLMRSLGIERLRWWARTPMGGPGSNACVQVAAAAVAAGAANYVLFYRAFNERSGRRFGQATGETRRNEARSGEPRRPSARRPLLMEISRQVRKVTGRTQRPIFARGGLARAARPGRRAAERGSWRPGSRQPRTMDARRHAVPRRGPRGGGRSSR